MKQPKYLDFIKENLFENVEDVYTIINAAADDIKDKFDISSKDKPEIFMTIFALTFKEFIRALQVKVANGYPRYKIVIANRLEIGFDNAENEEYEKNGGFMIYIKHLYNTNIREPREPEFDDSTMALCVEWNSINIVTDIKIINDVVSDAAKKINEYDIKIEMNEIIMPIFISIYESLINYIKIKRTETKQFDYEINFLSLFDVAAQESDDGDDIIRFTPSIENKLAIKSDAKASSQYD